jgi:hypothetical protein
MHVEELGRLVVLAMDLGSMVNSVFGLCDGEFLGAYDPHPLGEGNGEHTILKGSLAIVDVGRGGQSNGSRDRAEATLDAMAADAAGFVVVLALGLDVKNIAIKVGVEIFLGHTGN